MISIKLAAILVLGCFKTATGSCICDLTAESCDAFCCCDPDCSSSVISLWQSSSNNLCAPEKFTNYPTRCKNNQKHSIDNGRRAMQVATDSINNLLCIYYDNSPDQFNTYDSVDESSIDSSTISDRLEKSTEYSDLIYFNQPNATGNAFSPGDSMAALVNSYSGVWSLPSADSFGECNNMNSASWLYSQTFDSCTRTIMASSLESLCNTELNYVTYVSGLSISKQPYPSNSDHISITIGNITFRNLDDESIRKYDQTTATTTFANCLCSNALLEANYIVYTNTAQDTPSEIWVNIVIGNVGFSATTCPSEQIVIKQKFSIKFYTGTADLQIRSGNIGYISGKPLIIGYKNETNNTMNVYEGGFPLSGASTIGECVDTDLLTSDSPIINFGHEMIYNCYLEMSYEDLKTYCTSTTDNTELPIFSTHSEITHIGKFGSIDYSNPDDWVEVSTSSSSSTPTFSETTGTCTIPNLLHYEIIVAKVGIVSNPQPKVIYAQRSYQANTQWVFRMKDKTQTQKFYNTVVISYVEYDDETQNYHAPAPNPIPAMPDDIMYPFKISHSFILEILTLPLIIFII
ncbi:unnamed protein product [Blepharisma stoltei]|uniref:Tectonic domain-containing protein n=1 Tax=Blepharisma stoltei TaxID=1481888 RepID=A0AAU9IWP8_9CILI|nr:unnamed protein product [Blepharisma stoltei]